jgi:hypothetical protein
MATGYRSSDQRISLTRRLNRDHSRTGYSLSRHNVNLQIYR